MNEMTLIGIGTLTASLVISAVALAMTVRRSASMPEYKHGEEVMERRISDLERDIQALQQGRNLRSAAVYNNEAHILGRKLGQICSKSCTQVGLVHGVSAIFDDNSGVVHAFSLFAAA